MTARGSDDRRKGALPREMLVPRSAPLPYRAVSADVLAAITALLCETGRLKSGMAQLQKQIPAAAWSERSAPSWAGFLKLVEQRLHRQNHVYRLLHVSAMDGHRTWQLPLSICVHLLAEKIIAADAGFVSGSRGKNKAGNRSRPPARLS